LVVGGATYEDAYRRESGIWRIAYRRVVRPFDLAPSAPSEGLSTSTTWAGHNHLMSDRDLPPNWPQAVWVPGTPDWEASATRWLLEQVPPEYRRYDVLRRYPVLLARFAGDHTNASLEAARTGWRSLRVALGDLLPAEALDAAMDAYEREGSRLAAMVGSIEVVSAALRGQRWVPRL
jgi:hypothetical protein